MPPKHDVPLDEANLISLFLESVVFGVFAVLYALAVWVLIYRDGKRPSGLNKALVASATLMFLLSIVHLSLDVFRAVTAFIHHGGVPGGAIAFYGTLNDHSHIGKNVIYITQTLVGDSFVTYRLFIVWGRNWFVITLPVLLILGTAVAGYGACVEFTFIKPGIDLFVGNLQPWITSFFALSLTTNLLATFLIAGRIVYSNRRVSQYRAGVGSSHWKVVEILIESAAIYSAALASLLGTYAAGSNAQYICLDPLQPLVGVVFTLIIIRVGLGYTIGASTGHTVDSRSAGPTTQSRGEFPMRPVAINVSVARTTDQDRLSFDAYDTKGAQASSKDSDMESGRAH